MQKVWAVYRSNGPAGSQPEEQPVQYLPPIVLFLRPLDRLQRGDTMFPIPVCPNPPSTQPGLVSLRSI